MVVLSLNTPQTLGWHTILDMVCIPGWCVVVDGLWAKLMSRDGVKMLYASVRDSRREPGGGEPASGSLQVGEALGTSLAGLILVGVLCMLLCLNGVGAGGGSGGGNATVHATDGGGTTAVGPRPRHSLLVISAVVEGVSIVSIVRPVRESYSHAVQSSWLSISANVKL